MNIIIKYIITLINKIIYFTFKNNQYYEPNRFNYLYNPTIEDLETIRLAYVRGTQTRQQLDTDFRISQTVFFP